MNRYMILACSDVLHETFDIYIDDVEAHTAIEAMENFFKNNFPFKEMGTLRGSFLSTKDNVFKAVPIIIDTDVNNRFLFLPYIPI